MTNYELEERLAALTKRVEELERREKPEIPVNKEKDPWGPPESFSEMYG